jgi:hypothetical protein
MESSIFCDILPYSPLMVNWCFAGTGCLYLQEQRISPARNLCERRFTFNGLNGSISQETELSLLQFNQNYCSYTQENYHVVTWGPSERHLFLEMKYSNSMSSDSRRITSWKPYINKIHLAIQALVTQYTAMYLWLDMQLGLVTEFIGHFITCNYM